MDRIRQDWTKIEKSQMIKNKNLKIRGKIRGLMHNLTRSTSSATCMFFKLFTCIVGIIMKRRPLRSINYWFTIVYLYSIESNFQILDM